MAPDLGTEAVSAQARLAGRKTVSEVLSIYFGSLTASGGGKHQGSGVISGFHFGGIGTPSGGFTFGSAKTIATTSATGFTFSTPVITGGLGLGTKQCPITLGDSIQPFAFGSAIQSAPATGLSFISESTPQTGRASFNAVSAVENAAQPIAFAGLPLTPATQRLVAQLLHNQSFLSTLVDGPHRCASLASASTADATTCSSTMLFTSMSNASTSAATGLSFGAPATSTGTFGGITLGFGLKFPGADGAAHTASTTASTTTTTTVTTTTTTTTTTSGFTLNLRSLTSSGINNIVPVGINSLPFTSTVNAIVTPVMTYGQLEGLINKWSLDLEDQEKYFLHQSAQVNAWDRTLIENGEKITTLHGEVEKVKLDQQRLEQELDFILSQQKELEDLLTPLEEFVKDQSGSAYLQHADEGHGKTYKLAENIDAQLKRMAQDLKDIIEHLNTFGSPADTTDPLQQICKILNAHMDSLQWINRNSDRGEPLMQVMWSNLCLITGYTAEDGPGAQPETAALRDYNSQSPALHHNPLRVGRTEFWDLKSAAYSSKLEIGACGNMKR
ncbi:PREDICTED: nuclear pore glycoprotein p62-like [Odobenus rosmarus divergens]|uniref:Nuclear pore glycoprotein p62 n=1 Tax=Odobenus rosmarus divergens TaxID=9708 RepID=A0A9B0HBR6_ODORO